MISLLRPNYRLISDSPAVRLWRKRAERGARSLAKPAVGLMREVPVWLDALKVAQGRGALALFLPAYGPHGAALLRIYTIAAALRALGWRTVVVPSTLSLAQRRRIIAACSPDVLVMQGARHALNRPAYYPGCPIVFDMDDADFHLPHLSEPVLQAMPHVAAVIAGSDYIAEWCLAAGAPAAQKVLTGMPVSARTCPPQASRAPVVAWAQTRPMTYRFEADLVRNTMRALTQRCPDVRLRLYDRQPGDDPAFLDTFERAGITTEWVPEMPFPRYLASFDDVSLGLAPLSTQAPFSRGKSIGKVLAYLDRRVPVIASAAGEHATVFDAQSGVVSNDLDVWVARAQALLGDAQAREAMAEAGFATFRRRFSTQAVAAQVAGILEAHSASETPETEGYHPTH